MITILNCKALHITVCIVIPAFQLIPRGESMPLFIIFQLNISGRTLTIAPCTINIIKGAVF